MILFTGLTNDKAYRTALAKGVGCKAKDLKSVMGANELKQFLQTAKPENFDPASPDFCVNLHLHTTASDGKFTPETLFNEIIKQDNKFVVSITDHDTTDGVKKALEYIAKETKKNLDKFKNVRFAPGIEFFGKYENSKLMKRPFELELLGYGINPYSKEFKAFEQGNRSKDRKVIDSVIRKAREDYGVDTFDFKEYKKSKILLNVPSGVHVEYLLKQYLQGKGLSETNRKDLFKDYFPSGIPTLGKILKASKGAIVGISHPMRMKNFYAHIKDKNLSEEEALLKFFKDFKEQGGQAAEGRYYLPPERKNQVRILPGKHIDAKKTLIADLCDQAGLLKTGGIDNHGTSLYKFL